MPCQSDPPLDYIFERQEELNVITRLACTYCKYLEANKLHVPPYAHKWWKRHKEIDAERKRREQEITELANKIKAIKAKLTPEEIKQLEL